MILLGLSGFKSAGKDTAGEYLAAHHGFTVLKFAGPLYASAAALLDVTTSLLDEVKNDPDARIELSLGASAIPVRKFTIREYLQRYGTEAHRDIFGRSFWTKQLMDYIAEEIGTEQTDRFVVTDSRFDNECSAIREAGGYIVRIHRGERASDHPSEDPPPAELIDFNIGNEGTLQELYDALDALVAQLEAR